MPTQPQPHAYLALRDQVEGLLSEGKIHTRQAGDWEKVETYWHIGDALQGHFHGHPRAEYGQQVVHSLSEDIGFSESVLWDILLFRRSLPTLPARGEYGWTHVREVLHLPTQDQRLYYLRATQEGHWSTRQLRAAIVADAYGQHTDQPWAVPPDEDPQQGQPLRARFGELHTYKVVPTRNPEAAGPSLDLGFGVTCRAEVLGLMALESDHIVTVAQGPDGTLTCTPRTPRTRRYTYVAWVERVIDGDTLIAIVDLGFGHETRPERLRLRGIDCPELATRAGRNARDFVEEALSQVSFIVVTTHATDAYGRYLADIRYQPGEPDPEVVRRRGRYLNRELLDQHLARRYVR